MKYIVKINKPNSKKVAIETFNEYDRALRWKLNAEENGYEAKIVKKKK